MEVGEMAPGRKQSRSASDETLSDGPSTPWWVQAITPKEEANNNSFSDQKGWALGDEDLHEHSALRVQYLVLGDLYKFYLDAAWKAVIWYYTATGALFAYFLNQEEQLRQGLLRWLLLFVAVLSVSFGYTYLRAASHLFKTINPLEYIARTLRLLGRPHLEFAVGFPWMQCWDGFCHRDCERCCLHTQPLRCEGQNIAARSSSNVEPLCREAASPELVAAVIGGAR